MSIVFKVNIPGEVEEAEVIEPEDAIRCATLDGGDGRLLVIEKYEFEPVNGRRAAPVVLIGFHDRAVRPGSAPP